MPNHISTNFRVTGPTAEVKRFINDANGNDCLLNLDSLLPMPSELRMVSSPVKIMTQAEIDQQWADWKVAKEAGKVNSFDSDKPFGLGITKETSDSYKSKYGVDNWYDWAIASLGCVSPYVMNFRWCFTISKMPTERASQSCNFSI
jgi:hypothetical protein